MTILSPGGTATPQLIILSRESIYVQIDHRRARLAKLEAEMIAACELAVLDPRPPTKAALDRAHWNRTTWQHYLAAGIRLEAVYGRARAVFIAKSAGENG